MKMNWGFSPDNVATAMKLPAQSPLRLTYHQQNSIKDTRKTVFHRDEKRDKTSARTSKINLEDFTDRNNVSVQPTFQELSMELKLNEAADRTQSENTIYARSLQNVKKALPNLQVIRFSGQHYYYPVNGSAEKLRNEILFVLNSLQTITREMRNLNLRGDNEEPLRYELYLVFDKKSVNQHQFQRHVTEVFGRSSSIENVQLSRELRSQVVRLNLNGVDCQLSFHFFTEIQMLDDLHGFLIHDRMGGSEALSRMLALTLELKLANEKFENKNLKFF